jgi:hypothetical protein
MLQAVQLSRWCNIMTCTTSFYMWGNSYQEIPLVVYTDDTRTVEVDPTTYVEAEYRIYTKDTCESVFSASLGSGLAVVGTQLVLTTQETDIDFSGDFDHVLRTALGAGELAPPSIDGSLTIFEVCAVV